MGNKSKQPRIAFVAESWGSDEEQTSRRLGRPMPLVGASGHLFNNVLKNLGIERKLVMDRGKIVGVDQPEWLHVTNVFNMRPERNEVKRLFVPRKISEKDPRAAEWPALEKGAYLDPAKLDELDRLFDELGEFNPSVIVAMGNAALWSLTRGTGIMAHRGCWHTAGDWTGKIAGVPVIPTIHPAAVLRKFVWLIFHRGDIQKALNVARGVLRPTTANFISTPTLRDLARLRDLKPPIVFDIETRPSFRVISVIGIGNKDFAVAVPFVDDLKPDRNYWNTPEEEIEAWRICKEVLENPKTEKVGQNCVAYDCVWLREEVGIEVAGPVRDTRLMHHSLWPELSHDLGAIVTSFPDLLPSAWKSEWRESKSDH